MNLNRFESMNISGRAHQKLMTRLSNFFNDIKFGRLAFFLFRFTRFKTLKWQVILFSTRVRRTSTSSPSWFPSFWDKKWDSQDGNKEFDCPGQRGRRLMVVYWPTTGSTEYEFGSPGKFSFRFRWGVKLFHPSLTLVVWLLSGSASEINFWQFALQTT